MKRKQENTMLKYIGEQFAEKNLKERMLEDFKNSLLDPKRVNFIDNNPSEGRYESFLGPYEDGTMTATLKSDARQFGITNPMGPVDFTLARITAYPSLIYHGTLTTVGIVHGASIANTPYVIVYRMDGSY